MGSNGVAPSKVTRALDDHAKQQEATLAAIIGESVALHLASLLPQVLQVLQSLPFQDDCFFCVLDAKRLVAAHQVACANALQAGEDQPELPAPPEVARSVTSVVVAQLVPTPNGPVVSSGSVPACWNHIELPSAPPRQSGLVGVDGRPTVRQ